VSQPRISVVIPTRNGAETLPALLDALWAQRTRYPVEIVAVDSGSTDGTLQLLRRRAHQLLQIAPETFNHGLTRNLGIERATGDVVVLLVQDALPLSDTWLATITAPLVADPALAGTFARQVPRTDATALTRRSLERWVAASSEPFVARLESRDAFDALEPAERFRTCAFDNVASCIRRSVWQEHPLQTSPIAEDVAWARDVLLAGYGLAFVPEAVVMHSHDRPALYEYRRTRVLHARLYELFGLQTIPTTPLLLRAMTSSLVQNVRCEWRTRQHLGRAAALAVAAPLGQFLGARDAIAERTYRPPAGTV
jgi:rhamnosyltransferase